MAMAQNLAKGERENVSVTLSSAKPAQKNAKRRKEHQHDQKGFRALPLCPFHDDTWLFTAFARIPDYPI